MDADEGEFEVDVLLAGPVLRRSRRGKGVGTGETIETRMMSEGVEDGGTAPARWTYLRLVQDLTQWGFRFAPTQPDAANNWSYYHPSFPRAREERVEEMTYGPGKEDDSVAGVGRNGGEEATDEVPE